MDPVARKWESLFERIWLLSLWFCGNVLVLLSSGTTTPQCKYMYICNILLVFRFFSVRYLGVGLPYICIYESDFPATILNVKLKKWACRQACLCAISQSEFKWRITGKKRGKLLSSAAAASRVHPIGRKKLLFCHVRAHCVFSNHSWLVKINFCYNTIWELLVSLCFSEVCMKGIKDLKSQAVPVGISFCTVQSLYKSQKWNHDCFCKPRENRFLTYDTS